MPDSGPEFTFSTTDVGPDYIPTDAEKLNHIGAVYLNKGQVEPARLHFLAALSLEPNNYMALQNLGAVLRFMRHYEAAESVAKRSVIVTEGRNPFCLSNLGVSKLGLRKYGEALEITKKVVVALPNASNWHNYGLVLYMVGRYKEALEAFDTSLALEPHNPQAQSDRALTLLSLCEIKSGLEAYEARWNILKQSEIWSLGIEEWKGQSLVGKRLLVHHEQGFGDSIMLVRLLDVLGYSDCDITLAVPEELIRLFTQSFPELHLVDWKDASLVATDFDYHSPLLSLMRWLLISRPEEINPTPYLKATRRVEEMKLPDADFRIGICWASGNHGPAMMERRRVVPVTQFLPLTELSRVSLISLQKGPGSEDLVSNGLEGIIYDVGHRIQDFADTAEIMSYLDLIISVDSAVAHLAGALGKPCIMLSPYTRCWRWWSNKSGWPWYNDMQQFHQSQDGTWNVAMDKALVMARGAINTHIR